MRFVEKFHCGDLQNCFNCPFQFNKNKWRIHFSINLINLSFGASFSLFIFLLNFLRVGVPTRFSLFE
nr:hypothetical protein [Leptospira noguchii]